MSDSDLQLLERYTRQHAEDAFAEIVRRYLDLVFSAALRQVRSPQLAEEVAQSAFTDLARQAHSLAPDTVLCAWLYQVTRRTAIDVVRREARRQLREQVACELNAMNSTAADWSQIEPLLDEAMQELDDADRTAVLLRYFENKSLREVGQTLGASEDAARKRVSRATERLREFFTKRGVAVGASGLVALVSANAVQAAPAGLAVTVSAAAAVAGSTLVATTTTATATKAIVMTTMQKTLIATVLVAAVGTALHEARQASRLRGQLQALQQQHALLAEQIQQLQQERDEGTKRLAAVQADLARVKDRPEAAELLKLRGEAAGLRTALAAAQQQNTAPRSLTNSASYPTIFILPTNQTVRLDPSMTRVAGLKPPTPTNLAFTSVNQLQNGGNATPEAAAQTALWDLWNNDGRGIAQLAYHDPQASESAEDTAAKLRGHLAVELSGASQVAVMSPATLGEDYSMVPFTASWPASAGAAPKSATGSLCFRRVNDHWYLDRYYPPSQTFMIKARQGQ